MAGPGWHIDGDDGGVRKDDGPVRGGLGVSAGSIQKKDRGGRAGLQVSFTHELFKLGRFALIKIRRIDGDFAAHAREAAGLCETHAHARTPRGWYQTEMPTAFQADRTAFLAAAP